MKIKKHIIFLFIIGIVSWNCNKNIESNNSSGFETVEPTKLEGSLYSNMSNVKEDISFSGNSTLFSNQSFSGNMTMNEDKTEAVGELFINGIKVQDFEIEITPESINDIEIFDNHDGSLTYNNIIDGKSATITNLTEVGLSASGHLDLESLSVDFSSMKQQQGATRGPILLGIAIAWAAVAIGTAVHCGYERTAARAACQERYDICNSRCGRSCAYLYTSGACGGTCDVQCR
jgi:hypothetical protein